MATRKDFALPDLGEGLTEAEVLSWLVAVGDQVVLNQPIVEVETAKAAVEIPSPYAGVVTALHAVAGDLVDVGAILVSFDVESTQEVGIDRSADEQPRALLVGSGPKPSQISRRPRRAAVPRKESVVAEANNAQPARVSAAAVGARAERLVGGVPILAKPPVRKLARDLGVDLQVIDGSGPDGIVTRSDVRAAAGAMSETAGPIDPDGREQRVPVRGVRRATATAMVRSAFSAPHVTEFVTVDVTPTMELVERLRTHPDFAGGRVTPLLLVAKALLVAVGRHPMVNSSWDEPAQEIVVKDCVNLGIAAATPRGLVVPNIKDAASLSLPALALALETLTTLARDGRTPPADMLHGTITITNVGVFGVDSGTPILNPGESVILCLGAVREQPWVHDGVVAIRLVTVLSMSFDHRVIDGQLGSEFLREVAGLLSDPWGLVSWA